MKNNSSITIDKAISAAEYSLEEQYWVKKLSGNWIKSSIPRDLITDVRNTGKFASMEIEFQQELFSRLKTAMNESNIRLFMILTTGLIHLLFKYTGYKDVIVGIPIEKQAAVGNFINTILPIRCTLNENMTFRDLLMRVMKAIVEACEHQNYPIETIPAVLNLPTNGDNDFPLFDIIILLDNVHDKNYIQNVKTNLILAFRKESTTLTGTLEYNPSRYESRTIKGVVKYYLYLLQESLFNPDVKLTEFSLLSNEEKQHILYDFNRTRADYPVDKTIQELFECQAVRTPDNMAVVEGNRNVTYKKLNEEANRFAFQLKGAGIEEESIAAVMGPRSIEMVTTILAILKSGGAYLPINAQDPDERIKYILFDSRAELILSRQEVVERKNDALSHLNRDKIILIEDLAQNNEESEYPGKGKNLPTHSKPWSTVYMIYTSGTTGKPKGVLIEHRALVNYICWAVKMYVREGKMDFPFYTSFSFDMSITSLFTPIISGNAVVIYGGDEKEFLLNKVLDDNKVGIIKATPSHLRVIKDKRLNNSRVKRFIVGGEKLSSRLARDLTLNFGAGIEIYNEYGPTEATVGCMIYKFDDKTCRDESVPIGIPADNFHIYLLGDDRKPVPPGFPGELYISGQGVARGYLNRPELTHERFLPDTFSPDKKMYRTGDRARMLLDRNIEFIERIDNQVKVRGYRIEIGEIEAQLRTYDGIKEVVVIPGEDISGDTNLIAYYISDKKIDNAAIIEYLSKKLPDYMVPLFYSRIDEIPLNQSGKVEKKALPPIDRSGQDKYIPPRDEIERKLVNIWSDLLGIAEKEISTNTSFFDLGGHSLSASSLVLRVHKMFSSRLPLVEVFKKPTIRGISEFIKSAAEDRFLPINQVEERQYYELSSAQQRLYFIQQLSRESISYNIFFSVEIEGVLSGEKLEKTFRKLIDRHEAFRTSFELHNGQPVQRIQKDVDFKIEYYESKVTEVDMIINNFQRPFVLNRIPLLRIGLITIGTNRNILMLDMHHIISDGISMDIFVKEFTALYSGRNLPDLKIHYKDYSEWQERSKEEGILDQQEKYWLTELEGELPGLDLPTDFEYSELHGFAGTDMIFALKEDTAKQLLSLSKKEDVTLYMLLMAVYYVFLSRISGQEDIIVGTFTTGRDHPDLDNVIGMFVNALAIRNYPISHKSFIEFLQEVKRSVLHAFENQKIQYEELLERVRKEKDSRMISLFKAAFLLQNIAAPQADVPGLTMKLYEYALKEVKFDLYLEAKEIGENLIFRFEYSTLLFKKETIERFCEYLKRIMNAIVCCPGQKLSEIEILSGEEKKRILYDFNDTGARLSADKTLHELFEEAAGKVPDQTALVHEDRGLTYIELNRKANQLARVLRTEGVKSNTIVGIMLERSFEMIIGIMGILKAGGAYLPLDINNPVERIKYMLRNTDSDLLLTQNKFLKSFEKRVEVIDLGDQRFFTGNGEDLEKVSTPENLIYVIHTSGSTGEPKGTGVYHRSFVNLINWFVKDFEFTIRDMNILITSPAFDLTQKNFFAPLLSGGVLCLAAFYYFDPGMVITEIEAKSVTWINCTPGMFLQITGSCAEEGLKKLESLRFVFLGGEPLSISMFLRWVESGYCQGEIVNTYGPTECTDISNNYRIKKPRRFISNNVPVGKPIFNVKLFVVDKNLKLLPPGTCGELLIGGEGVSAGYVNDIEMTDQKFIFLSFAQDERPGLVYRTGDLAKCLPDGEIEILGRIDQQIKIRGFRVELEEIENRLLMHKDIKEAVVITKEDKKREKYLCAYVVLDIELNAVEIREYLSKYLPDYMIPAHFFQLDKIPLTLNGKVDKKALDVLGSRLDTDVEYVAPAKMLEKMIADVWKEILNIDKISIYDNFFDIGGNSISIIRANSKINEILAKDIPIVEMFNNPTIYLYAKYLSEGDAHTAISEEEMDEDLSLLEEAANMFVSLEE